MDDHSGQGCDDTLFRQDRLAEILGVGVSIFQIQEHCLFVREMRTGMPRSDVQFDDTITGNMERRDALESHCFAWCGDAEIPVFASDRAEALAYAHMASHLSKP